MSSSAKLQFDIGDFGGLQTFVLDMEFSRAEALLETLTFLRKKEKTLLRGRVWVDIDGEEVLSLCYIYGVGYTVHFKELSKEFEEMFTENLPAPISHDLLLIAAQDIGSAIKKWRNDDDCEPALVPVA